MVEDEQDNGSPEDTRIVVYLDDQSEPLLTYQPPVRFELDSSLLEDGHHCLRVEAYGSTGQKGVRVIPFTVRNGPGIAVSGLRNDDVLEGRIPILINSYGGAGETQWEPSRAETPAPIPTWAWVLFIVIVAFGAFYGVQQWSPPPSFAATPTYGPLAFAEEEEGLLGIEEQNIAADPMGGGDGARPAATAPASAESVAASAANGKRIYSTYCASCHQASGQGLPGVFPPLAGDPVVTAEDPTAHIRIVLTGLQGKTIGGVSYASPMPAFGDQLSDEEVAAVINHERTSWGNEAPTVTAKDVAKLRGSQ